MKLDFFFSKCKFETTLTLSRVNFLFLYSLSGRNRKKVRYMTEKTVNELSLFITLSLSLSLSEFLCLTWTYIPLTIVVVQVDLFYLTNGDAYIVKILNI